MVVLLQFHIWMFLPVEIMKVCSIYYKFHLNYPQIRASFSEFFHDSIDCYEFFDRNAYMSLRSRNIERTLSGKDDRVSCKFVI